MILRSRWADSVSDEYPWPEYPRPQLVRPQWVNLNGKWDASVHLPDEDPDFTSSILVPFPIGSALSGFDHILQPTEVLTVRTSFDNPLFNDSDHLRLHFGAVDWACTIWVNGQNVGCHEGGFDPFYVDITDALIPEKVQELIVSITDPTDTGNQPIGKQTLNPFAIQYTAVAGIWQTVWLEPVPKTCIEHVFTQTAISKNMVNVFCSLSNAVVGSRLRVTCLHKSTTICEVFSDIKEGEVTLSLSFEKLHLWCPDDPFLYDLVIEIIDEEGAVIDTVQSYFGAREISSEVDADGFLRLTLNGCHVFHLGLLDQGWWPDGLYTAPTDEALAFDIEATLAMGFNTIRKHVKVEPARWYWHADRLGALVWQDMPSTRFDMIAFGEELKAGVQPEKMDWSKISPGNDPKGFRKELDAMIRTLQPFASIVVWVPFNEAWGQHDTDATLSHVIDLDPSRLVNGPSGWTDTGSGHIRDHHLYQNPERLPDHEDGRVTVYGEFGGISLFVDGHTVVSKGWGYTKAKTESEFLESYKALMHVIVDLVPKGLAGAIYTQTTDVESEINGLLTYDRIYKVAPEQLHRVNKPITH